MAAVKTVRDHLLDTLDDLAEEELRRFKHKLNQTPVKAGFANIPRGRLQNADRLDLSDLLLGYYGQDYAVDVTVEVLRAVHLHPQADALGALTGKAGSSNPGHTLRGFDPVPTSYGRHSVPAQTDTSNYIPPEKLSKFLARQIELRVQQDLINSFSVQPHVPPAAAPRGRCEMQTPSSSEPHFIDLHREQLIQRTSNVEGVLDLLYGNILDSEEYERICSARTNPGKMRELYNVVPSWNRACKDKLYEALKLKNKFLIADLEGR